MLKSANRQILIVIGRIERMEREDGRRRGGIAIGPGRRWEMGEERWTRGERREWQTRGGKEREERTA